MNQPLLHNMKITQVRVMTCQASKCTSNIWNHPHPSDTLAWDQVDAVSKIDIFCSVRSQSDVLGKDACKMHEQWLCQPSSVAEIFSMWLLSHWSLRWISRKAWKRQQSSCWLPSFPDPSINAAVHRRHLTSLFSPIWLKYVEGVNDVCFPNILSS